MRTDEMLDKIITDGCKADTLEVGRDHPAITHTPGELKVVSSKYFAPTIYAGRRQIATVLYHSGSEDAPIVEANAARFVRTWNSHDALVDAADHLIKELNDWSLDCCREGLGNTNVACIQNARDKLRAALKLAQETQ